MRFVHYSFVFALALIADGCAVNDMQSSAEYPPVIFMHGNGDTAALWHATVWRFESNGWPRERLFAVDAIYPLARNQDDKAQEGRSSAAENTRQLAAEIERVRMSTGAQKVILIGNSRGGYAIRDYVQNGGAANVSKVILGGTPNHGVFASSTYLPGSEFNGKGQFLSALNAPRGSDGLEVTPGVSFLTLRSDKLDKFAQADGIWIGQPGKPTNVTADGPALKGAENVVLPGRDHRETSFHPDAFVQIWRFITGKPPARTDIAAEAAVTLNGKISGLRDADPSNLPLVGARLQIFEVEAGSGERRGAVLHEKTIAADGMWGPFIGKPDAYYEFVVGAEGYAIAHYYRSPFPRSSALVHLRAARLSDTERDGAALVMMTRPRGYYAIGRDSMSLDGKSPPPGVPAGVPGVSSAKLKLNDSTQRTVVAQFNDERIALRTWPLQEGHLAIAEFHY